MTTNNPVADLLTRPIGPDWAIEKLAEEVLGIIASQSSEESCEIVLDDAMDRQSRRLLRPLLACLATKSADEAGTPVNVFGDRLSFQRPGPKGSVWILGQFENRPGCVRIRLQRSSIPQFGTQAPNVTWPQAEEALSLLGNGAE